MGYHKGHKEFHALDMDKGWHTPPGYPSGIQQKIIAGELDEKARRGNRPGFCALLPASTRPSRSCTSIGKKCFLSRAT